MREGCKNIAGTSTDCIECTHTQLTSINLISTFLLQIDISSGLLFPGGIIHTDCSVLAPFIRYIYYWNLQFINNVIITNTKVPIPQAYVTLDDFGYRAYILWVYCSQTLYNDLAFQSFDFELT